MLQQLLILAAVGMTPIFASAQCTRVVDEHCADAFVRMQVKRGQPSRLNLRLAHNDALKVVLPEGLTIDKGSFAIGSSALKYEFDDDDAPSSFLLAARPPKRGSNLGQRTNVLFELAGQTIILNIKISAEAGAQQVSIDFPEVMAERAREAALRDSIRGELEAQLTKQRQGIVRTSKALAEDQIMDAALKRLTCSKAPERGFDQFLVLVTQRICAFGEWIFIEATLENGRLKSFEQREVKVEGIWAGEPRPLDFKVRWITATTPPKRATRPLKLAFEDTVRGMFLIKPPEGELPDSYRITIFERGGLKRVVVADDVEF